MISGKNIVLTGANSGIGLETMKLLTGNGNRIFAVDIRDDRMRSFGDDVIPYICDISVKENVDRMFEDAVSVLGTIDIFYANAGYMHFERMNHPDWERTERMFRTNSISPIYSYQKYIEHLNGRSGIFAMTVSAMGKMGMPGFALYSATKFALNGFQESIRLEKPDRLQITCLYPVSTDTAFFASDVEIDKPYPVQTPDVVAKKMLRGIEKGRKKVNPCKMFTLASGLFKVFPFVRSWYWGHEKKKFLDYEERCKRTEQ